MDYNDGKIFKELTPPPGGLEDFRVRLEKESAHARMRLHFIIPVAASVVFCLTLLIFIRSHDPAADRNDFNRALSQLEAENNPAMIRLGLVDPPREPITVPVDQRSRMAVQRVTVTDHDVIYYRLDVLDTMDEEGESDF